MEIQFYCPHWGSEHLPFNVFLDKVKDAGYQGVEMSLPLNEEEKNGILEQIRAKNLLLIAQHWETVDRDFETHARNFETRLKNLASASPQFINSQTGKDYYSFEQNATLIRLADKIALETGIRIVHETHRGKFSFAAHITKQFLDSLPDLKITLDISHWCNVAETNLYDQPEAVETAISRTAHIHSRVGHTQGPQVNDPRAPEWKEMLDMHLSCWDRVIAHQKTQNQSTFTITTEFGPLPYMPALAHTGMPVANQWDINVFMKNLLANRYSN